jgi:hypothetical protein
MTQLRYILRTFKECELWPNSSDWSKPGVCDAADLEPAMLMNMVLQTQTFVDKVECSLDLQQREALTALMLRMGELRGARESGVYLQLFQLVVFSSSPQSLALANTICWEFERRVQQQQLAAVAEVQLQGFVVQQLNDVQLSAGQLQQTMQESREWGMSAMKQQQQCAEQMATAQPGNEVAAQLLAAIMEVQARL